MNENKEKIVIFIDGKFHSVDELLVQDPLPLGEFIGKVFEFFGKRILVTSDMRVDEYRYLGCVYEESPKGLA